MNICKTIDTAFLSASVVAEPITATKASRIVDDASEVSGGKQIDYYQFAPLTDEVTRTFSSTPVMNDSLRAANIFGDNTSLSGKTLNRTRWGYIELNTTIVHPSWLEKGSIANVFIKKTSESKSIQYCTNTDLAKIRDGQSYVYTAAYSLSQLNILSAKEYEELDDADKLQYMTGLKALTYVFQHYDVEASLSLLKSRYNYKYDTISFELTMIQFLHMLKKKDHSESFGSQYFVVSRSYILLQDYNSS